MPVSRKPGRRGLVLGATALAGAAVVARARSQGSDAPIGIADPAIGIADPAIEIADMMWTDVRDAIARGARTVVVPTGGLEQNGPHMIIGKHDRVVRWAARRVATQLGNALVAPVVSYVPEGEYEPPTGHMGFPGTIGVAPAVFEGVLDGIARSLRAGGFTAICFMSDHGGSAASQAAVAARLAAEWRGGTRVIDVSAYYSDALETDYLHAQGETDAAMGQHGGIADTAELMAAYPEGVDLSRLPSSPALLARLGASGEPGRANAAHGRALMALRIDAAVRQIRAAMGTA